MDSDFDLEISHLASILFLMEERHKPDSYWKDYIGTFPEEFSSYPTFFTDEELALLQGSAHQQRYERWTQKKIE